MKKKCIEQNMPLYMTFVDFTKTFDAVNREVLWNILHKLGSPDHFTKLLSALHTRMKASGGLKRELLEQFEVWNGVNQGCVLTPPTILDFSFYGLVWLFHWFHQRSMNTE